MKPWPHQIEVADKAYGILQELGWVYISLEERCGKTLSAILLAEKSKAKKILVLTKKKAIPGWEETFEAYGYENMLGKWMKGNKQFKVTNYHQVHKLGTEWDLVILDECFVGSTKIDGKRIDEIKVGDYVTTRQGKKRVYAIHQNEAPEELVKVVIGGREIICTPDHLFYTENRGWIPIKEATNEDVFILQD